MTILERPYRLTECEHVLREGRVVGEPPESGSWIVVGGGVLGTVTAAALARAGRRVTLVESTGDLGGLTATQTLDTPRGEVVCDRFYHVILESDARLLRLLSHLGLSDGVRWTSAPTVVAADGVQHPASSLVEMATLPAVTTPDRARIAASVGAGLVLPMALAQRVTAAGWLTAVAGRGAMTSFWGPILRAKLGTQADAVSASFLVSTFRRLVQARVKGAGDRFGVLPTGYGPVFAALKAQVVADGAQVRTGATVATVRRTVTSGPRLTVTLASGAELAADNVVVTTPGPVTDAMLPELTADERHRLTAMPYLGVICGTFLVETPPNDAYITYLVDDVGITGVIGMHALIDPATTRGYHLVYVPRYCAPDDPWFDLTDAEITERLLRAVRTALPGTMADVVASSVSRARHVMPVPTPEAPAPVPTQVSVPGVHVVSAAQNTTGTLNVEASLGMAAGALHRML